jgi:hypothetical protein
VFADTGKLVMSRTLEMTRKRLPSSPNTGMIVTAPTRVIIVDPLVVGFLVRMT